jgi:hypothetical protein
MKIYISGKITGLDIEEAMQNFEDAEVMLNKLNFDTIFNPFKVCKDLDPNTATWDDYMIKNIEVLLKCDSIFMLSNWEDSKGARLEFDIAKSLGVKIYHELKRESLL